MKNIPIYAGTAALLAIAALWLTMGAKLELTTAAESAAVGTQVPNPEGIAVASPGRVEGASDSIAVGAAVSGIVQNLYVAEGQDVQSGAVLARIGCQDVNASLQVAKSEVESLRQVG